MEKTVDARGLACPQPVVKTKEAIGTMQEGTLRVLVDNEIAVQNVMKLGNYEGLSAVSEKKGEKEYEILFQIQKGGKEEGGRQEEYQCIPDERRKGLVTVISSDEMGSGSGELGQILMKGFIYALTQLDRLPETILLYNGGAKLTVEGSKSLEDFKTLEAEGVKILTCGTCLNYYGLSNKLAVGTVTNMYEIAETMAKASSILRP